MKPCPYVVGIDLGTTNCALAWSPVDGDESSPPRVLPIPQRDPSGAGVVEEPQLPSFLYDPPEHERARGEGGDLSWAGLLAREQLHRTPGRVVSSAKSWLSAPHVDRRAPILPWKGEDDVTRLSPVAASAAYLDHMRRAWNRAMAERDAACRLEEQLVVLTVPASFDAVARELTVEAARRAGLERIHLFEEPLAALHSWLHENRSRWRSRLRDRPMLLVVDVGGGTTDFTLVALRRVDGRLQPCRHAVGEHLLAGGDNVDLALARHVEERLGGPALDLLRFAALTQACRAAKERLLREDAPESHPVIVLGRGSSVVGGTTRTELGRDEVHRIVLDGFFPETGLGEVPSTPPRSGLVELGLPYAPDPAVTRNLARFLRSHLGGDDPFPEAVLFAGGTLVPRRVRERILHVCRSWGNETGGRHEMVELDGGDLSLSIARGAVLHGLAKLGRGLRIGGGSRRSYYMGLGGARQEALCVLPASAEEGQTFRIDEEGLHLRRGRPVRFSLYTSHVRPDDAQGTRIDPSDPALRPLPPLHAVLPGAKDEVVPVQLEAGLGEVGTLDVGCIEREGGRRHRLRFELGGGSEEAPSSSDDAAAEELHRARSLVRTVFERKKVQGRAKEESPRLLGKNLEALLKRKRADWSLAFCRGLWEELAERAPRRRRSEEDEAAWFHLAGFCLRPGFGAPSDEWRITNMRPLLDEGLQRRKHAEVRLAWWIFWRRLAAGLDDAFQTRLFDAIAPGLLPGRRHLQRGPQPTEEERREIWRLAGACEGLDEPVKIELARAALGEGRKAATADAATWTFGRVLARRPFGPKAHRTLAVDDAIPLVKVFLDGPWRSVPSGPQALLEACRLTGDRGVDLPDELRLAVRDALAEHGTNPERLRVLTEVIARDDGDASASFGESLPEGLVLA